MVVFTQILAAVALVVVMVGLVALFQWGGIWFVSGGLLVAAIYQLGYRAKHGTWFNLID